mgnify:CR=1 FL=1
MKQKIYENALEFVRTRLNKLKSGTAKGSVKERESLEVAKSAIERQITIKAIVPKSYEGYACPRCGHHFEKKPFYCHNCGQHINYPKGEKDKIVSHEHKVIASVSMDKVKENELIITIGDTSIRLDGNLVYHTLTNGKATEVEGSIEYKEYK